MILPIGTRVRLLHTGETGTVKALLPNGMLEVYLESADMEIPAAAEDLVVLHNQDDRISKILKQPSTKPAKTNAPVRKPPKSSLLESKEQIDHSSNRGLLLVFDPIPDAAGFVYSYRVHLLNDSSFQLLYDVKIEADQGRIINKNGKLEKQTKVQLGLFSKDLLNENPDVISSVRAMSTDAPGPWKKKNFRIKPKPFFNKAESHPDFEQTVHVFPIEHQFLDRKGNGKRQLQQYTSKNLPKEKPGTQIGNQLFNIFDVEARANFKQEIDLHIEKLHPHPGKLASSDIVDLQLGAFDTYVEQAIKLGIPHVFIIHGKGTGRLRAMIEKKLSMNRDVRKVEGGYHEGYEFGATKVYF